MPKQQPWHTRQWYVSPWNYLPEVTKDWAFAPRPAQNAGRSTSPAKNAGRSTSIQIHDITLRDGEQQAGIAFSKDDKIRIAEQLAETGVHRIEAGMPAVSPDDAAAIKEIVKRNLGPEIYAFSRCMVEDVKRAVDCGVHGVVMEIPASEHIVQHAYRWPLEKAIELSITSTRYAHEQGLRVVFFPIDASRADIDWYLDLISKVAREGHMDALAMVDTFGVLSPHAIPYLIRRTKERINKPLETHFHDDFGMGAANTVLALAAGADVAHVTVLGIGERAGNAPLEEVALTLLTMYGVDVGLKYDKLYELAMLVKQLSNQAVPSNKGVVGDWIFNVESGIIATWLKNAGDEHLLEVFPFRPELVGHHYPQTVLGKNSGRDNIQLWLDELGVRADPQSVDNILALVKQEAVRTKRLLDEQEFAALVRQVVGVSSSNADVGRSGTGRAPRQQP